MKPHSGRCNGVTGKTPILRQHTHAICTFRRLSVSDWNSQNGLEFREGLAEMKPGCIFTPRTSRASLGFASRRWHCCERGRFEPLLIKDSSAER